jgi:hypothetical protein
MKEYLEGLIKSVQDTLDTIARNAKDAGASEQELAEIELLARNAASSDPIDVEEWDGGESALFAAWVGWRLGKLQGTLNSFNGVTDIGIGAVNQGITIVNPLGQLFGLNPQIPLWDWSRGRVTDEDPTLHEWSKWLGGSGFVGLASLFPFLPKGFKSGDFVKVVIRNLQYPVQRPFADLAKLAKQGPFDITKYTPPPVLLKRNGVMVLQNGVTRIENAKGAEVFELIVQIFTR